MNKPQFNIADAKSKRDYARDSMLKKARIYAKLGLDQPWREGSELASESFDMDHDFMWDLMGVRSKDERFNDDDWRLAFLAGFSSKAKYLKTMKRHVELRAKYNFHVTGNV